jgi:translation elongation factor EF-Tu-like GTPase
MVVFMNKVDMVDDEELLELVEMERDLYLSTNMMETMVQLFKVLRGLNNDPVGFPKFLN